MATSKPDLSRVWASGAPGANIIDPDVTTPGKVAAGWTAEIPPFEHFNFLQNWYTGGLAHANEQGIMVWDATTTYPIHGLAKGSDGEVYKAISEQSGNDPTTDGGVNWESFLASSGLAAITTAILTSDLSSIQIFQTGGYAAIGDGGGARWLATGNTGTPGTSDLANGLLYDSAGNEFEIEAISGAVNINQFGAKSDGTDTAGTTTAIQNALDYCSSKKLDLFDVGGTYSLTTVRVKNGIRRISFVKGTITPTNASLDGVIEFEGINKFGAAAIVRNCRISVRMDMAAGDRTALFMDGTSDCEFDNNRIFGYTNHATLNHYGLLFWFASNRNDIHNNSIVGFTSPTQRGLLIDFIGEADDFGNFFAGLGAVTRATKPCLYNNIHDNFLSEGSYAVNMLGCEKNLISSNVCLNQNHRSIYMAQSCWYNEISDNFLSEFLSSGVLLGYGSSHNLVANNMIVRETAYNGGEAGVNINTGAKYNLVYGNHINAACNYGIYMATDCIGNEAKGNKIWRYYQAGIAIENDWTSPNPTNAFYSRPNFGAPPVGTDWSFNDAVDNVIENNSIYEAHTGRNVAAIYVAQIETASATATRNNIVKGNQIMTGTNIAYNLFLYENAAGKLSGLKITDNLNHVDNSHDAFNPAGSDTLNDKIEYFNNNVYLDDLLVSEPENFIDADITPSVAINSKDRYFQMANTGATTVTYFDDGFDGQEIRVRLDINTTIEHNNAFIRNIGAVDITGGSNTIVTFKRLSNVWFELFKNV